jgi:hypothetical protein
MNIFQLNYDARLRSWYDLRADIEGTTLENKCIAIDNWWQKAPLVNHYLHVLDTESWPGPWDLLVENTYCTVAKALGICYTLSLVGVNDIKMVEATDRMGEDVVLVLVDNAKYVLNYWPDTVISNTQADFTIKRNINITHLDKKLQ